MFPVMVLNIGFVCGLKSICTTDETLMIKTENGLERKKIAYFSLKEDVSVLQEDLKF